MSTCSDRGQFVFDEVRIGRYDRSGEDRYDMISALHKSLRGSDGSAAMYWLARFVTPSGSTRVFRNSLERTL
jgi:replication-associated recombination protein RarA